MAGGGHAAEHRDAEGEAELAGGIHGARRHAAGMPPLWRGTADMALDTSVVEPKELTPEDFA